MSFNVQNFSQNIANFGISQSNKFEVSLTLPNALAKVVSNPTYSYLNQFQQIMPMRASNCVPPGVVLMTNETHKLGIGPRIKMPYNAIFSEFRVTLLADAESIIESTFNLWLNISFNYTKGGSIMPTYYTAYRDDIVSPSILISKFDRNGQKILDYNLYDAIPTAFISQGLDWELVNTLNKFTASFQFTSYSITTYS